MNATIRYCRACRAEVEDVGGFCLLGHDLRHASPVASLTSLKDEVDEVFQQAEVVAVAAFAPAGSTAVAPAPAPPAVRLDPAPRRTAPPPPPPAAATIHPSAFVNQPRPNESDPIAAFAPPPSMDWGPERPMGRLLRRRS